MLWGFCELSGYWSLCYHWITVRSRHHFALHLRLIYTHVSSPFNTMLPILLRRLNLYYLWSQSIVKSLWPTQIFRSIMLRGFCELSVYWPLCRHWSSAGQAKKENQSQGTYILLDVFMSLQSIWRAFRRVKYRKTSKSIYIWLSTFFWNTGWCFHEAWKYLTSR